MGVTRELCNFVYKNKFTDLDDKTINSTKTAILNIIGCMIAGYQTRIGKLHTEIAKDMGGGRDQSTIIGDGSKVSIPLAAYANGNFGFALDYEDTVLYIAHPGYITTSSGFAMAEYLNSSGEELITSINLGFEIVSRIGAAMQPSPERGSKVWGEQYHPFASAVTVSKLLKLDSDQINVAFGIAGTYATVPSVYKYFGLVEETRPMREVKLGWGWMSMAGTVAAQSAHKGFKGGHGILDGEQGFYIMAGSDKCDFNKITKDLGETWVINNTEYKIHPSIAWNHPLFDATRKLVTKYKINPEAIEKINISGMAMHLIGDKNPRSAVDAQFSLPYTVATTLLSEPLSPDLYSDEKLSDPKIKNLLSRINLSHDKSADADFFSNQKMRFSIEIIKKNNENIKSDVEWPKDQPATDQNILEKKFRLLAGTYFNDERVEEIYQTVNRLEEIKNINELIKLLY